ncbi:NAD(FAD)-utilizing dehydrogenases [hydrothermal vent metagenome]|uniref:NAD(FAD)-utilizing dehydrogenases n=1 Tax=hydrothermal vent metagenome TaxID=652676 RepID=A0A1W1EDG6_9ZZZZ
MNQNIIIIGGGASALMLASLLPKNSVTIIESNSKLGAKILVSGGGKCNITNVYMGSQYFLGDKTFVESSIDYFDNVELLTWLKKRNLIPVLRDDRHYFCKNSAKEILDVFKKESKKQTIRLNEKVLSVTKRDDNFIVKTDKSSLQAKYVVVASGGLSFPKIGASSIGYDIAQSFGHSIKKTAAGLVGFTVQKDEFFFKELSGISTDVVIDVGGNICSGALLFTHKGISGPSVLDASLYWDKGKISIDFLPDFKLSSIRNSKKQLSSLLPIPKRLTKSFLIQLKLEDKRGNSITSDDLLKLETLKSYTFSPAGTFGYSKAEVTKGGVNTEEVDAFSMQSRKIDGLFFTGEVLDVTGRLGGYNLQWAFSSAYTCAQYINEEIK